MKHYSVREVAHLFNRAPRTIRDWITTGCVTSGVPVRLDAVRVGRWWTVSEDALVLFRHRLGRPAAAARPRLDEEAETAAASEPATKQKGIR